MRKVKVELKESIVNDLIKLKTKTGQTYSDIIENLLKEHKKRKQPHHM